MTDTQKNPSGYHRRRDFKEMCRGVGANILTRLTDLPPGLKMA